MMSSSWYSEAALKIRDPRLLFMNHGYWTPGTEPLSSEIGAYAHQLSEALVLKVMGDLPAVGDRILDVGCGRGGACALLARVSEAARIVGLDRCEEGIATCRQNVVQDHVEFVVGDAQDLPFPDASFERLVNIESSHGYPNRRGFFDEVHRVLVPGGVFNYTDGIPLHSLDQHHEDLEAAGLIVDLTEDITEPVIEALVRCSDDRRAFFETMIAAGTADEAFANRLCNALTSSVPDMYRQKSLNYIVWRCHKPEQA
jgi:SAM-dependent methyltransferase